MIDGPFKINVSSSAEKLSFDALSEQERQILFSGTDRDPALHGVYRFFVVAEPKTAHRNWSARQLKRKCFTCVDRVYLSVKSEAPQISFRGIYPPNIDDRGQLEFDFQAYAEGKILELGKAGLKLSGPIKTWFRTRRRQVVAQRTDVYAQWIYTRHWLARGDQIQAELLCVVPADLEEKMRSLSCCVDFKDGGRAVERREVDVRLPV